MPACGPSGLRGHLGSCDGQEESGVAMHRCRGWVTIHTLQDHMSTKLRKGCVHGGQTFKECVHGGQTLKGWGV